jgi:ketosteroid isomerase-like protein
VAESNVEMARRGFSAVMAGDLKVLEEILDPEVKWHGREGLGSDSCHNREQALHFMRRARARARGRGELVDVIDCGEQVVVVMRPPAQEDGERPALRANLTTFRDGRVIRMVAYDSPEAALAAAGKWRSENE